MMSRESSPRRLALFAAFAGSVLLVGCGSAPRVPADDAAAIFRALEQGQVFSRQICGEVGHPLSPATRHAYALMIAASTANPEAELQSQDFADDHPPIRTWLRRAAQAIAVCRRQVPAAGPGWRDVQLRILEAASRQAPE